MLLERVIWYGNWRGIAMYRVVYWTGVTMLVAWSVFSAYSALSGL
jgi:hypothetical protein